LYRYTTATAALSADRETRAADRGELEAAVAAADAAAARAGERAEAARVHDLEALKVGLYSC
jgi:hypothetical protein